MNCTGYIDEQGLLVSSEATAAQAAGLEGRPPLALALKYLRRFAT